MFRRRVLLLQRPAVRCLASPATYPKPLQSKALRQLRDNQKLLDRYQARVVQIPETGVLAVLYPCCHTHLKDVGRVQELLQHIRFHQVCVELCSERAQSLGEQRDELRKRNVFLKTDIEKVLNRAKGQGSGEISGWEMIAAVLEADRHRIPVMLVDRLRSVTRARLQVSIAVETVPALWMPRVLLTIEALRLTASQCNGHVPLEGVMRAFRRGIQIPWEDRRAILSKSLVHNGSRVIPVEALNEVFKRISDRNQRLQNLPIDELKFDSLVRMTPMPKFNQAMVLQRTRHLHDLGPESLQDVFARVISDERDDVLAHNIRTRTAPDAKKHGYGGGPLVFAAIGAAHLEGVAERLQESASSVRERAELALALPHVPPWRRLLLPERRILQPFSMTFQVPLLPRLSVPKRTPTELATL